MKFDEYESYVAERIEAEINAGKHGLDPKSVILRRKPTYYSRARESNIVFDASVEVTRPEQDSPFFYWVIECKYYKHNVPIDDLVATIDKAIEGGYTVAWDGDVSEVGFSRSKGIAVLPAKSNKDYLTRPGKEIKVDQDKRQTTFEEHSTTDDHLMHLTGIATDQDGTKYYIVKNSWGERGKFKGFIHLSESYVRMKTVSILVHKDAVPDRLSRD